MKSIFIIACIYLTSFLYSIKLPASVHTLENYNEVDINWGRFKTYVFMVCRMRRLPPSFVAAEREAIARGIQKTNEVLQEYLFSLIVVSSA